ncbi:hypothetical protein Tco_0527185 [Tanacetum coccineum]
MGEPAAATESSGTPSTIERSPLDFDNENPSQQINEGDGTENQVLETGAPEVPPTEHASTTGVAPNIVIEEEDAADVPLVSKRRRKRVNDGADANAQPKVLRKDFDVSRPAPSTFGGKSFASTGLEASFILSAPASQGTPAGTIDPNLLSFTEPQPAPTRDIAESPGGIHQPGWGITNNCRFDTPGACQDVVDHMVPPSKCLPFEAQVTGEEQIKAAFEEFKKLEEDNVERRCAEMDARLDALSIDFDEELYPYMFTAIAGRRWVIGYGLRLAVMKCAESTDLRQAFANVVSAGIAKGMSEGLKHGVEHGKAQLELEVIETYDLEANAKYDAALHALKDLEYPLIVHLEKLKDAPHRYDYDVLTLGE